MRSKEYKQVLGCAAAMTVFARIAHAGIVGSSILLADQERPSFLELATMVLFGLGLLGVAAIIRWRVRTKGFSGK